MSFLDSRYRARRRNNAIAMALSVGATVFGLGWLVLILGALLWQGFSGLSPSVFTQMTPPPGASGGLLNPIFGSIILTALALLSERRSAFSPAPIWPSTAGTIA